MNVIVRQFRKRGLRFKLLFYFFTLILLPLATLGIIGNLVSVNTVEDEANNYTAQMIEQVMKNVDSYIENVKQSMELISLDPATSQFLNTSSSSAAEQRQATETDVRRMLSNFTSIHPEIAGIILVNEHDMDVSNEMFRVSRDPLTNEEWYRAAMANRGQIQLISKPIGRNIRTKISYSPDDVLSVVKAIKNPETGAFQGVVLIDFKLATIENVIRGITIAKNGFIFILDQQGNVVYAPENPIVYRVRADWLNQPGEDRIVKTIRNERYQIDYTASNTTQWKTVGVFSLNKTLQDVTKIRNVSLLLGGLTTALAVLSSLFFTRSIVRPIGKLRQLMKQAEEGDLNVRFESASEDEVGQLGRSFNNMISEIRKLIDLVYEEQTKKREAELRILQAQIKPHFLYNTLDTIQWMAQERNAEEIVVLILALTNLFRIGLSKGREKISVHEEIEHIKNYLFIQKARYESKFEYEIDVADEIMNEIVLKLTLQPLVENAIYHGIKARRGKGFVKIEACKVEDKLCLRVTDDGGGVPPYRLAELQSKLAGGHVHQELLGYGLFNVHERIRLVYGDAYGVTISSSIGQGTKVEVWYPLTRSESGDVESDDSR